MIKSNIIIWVLFLVSASLKTLGQTTQIDSSKFNVKISSFDSLVNSIESQKPLFFYYDKQQTDSLKISVPYNGENIQDFLLNIFKSTNFKFSMVDEKTIFISKNVSLKTELPLGFFDINGRNTKEEVPNYFESIPASKLKSGLENKLYEIGVKTDNIKPGTAILTGYIKDIESGEPIVGAILYAEKNTSISASTDAFGYFSITVPKGRIDLVIKSIGLKPTKRQIMMYSDGRLNIEMQQDVVALREVLIQKDKDANISRTTMGIEKLDAKTLKQVPSVFGESDVLRVVMALPGVQTVGESSSGLNVRGGSTDQNLILFNDATIYNPTHLFGFFSAFNPDIIKDVELYKSSIPAEYGGRLSSVLSLNSRDGNKKKISGTGGIGLLTGRLTIEGPIIKNKVSFLIGGRSTYSDWLLKQIPNTTLQKSQASFNDVNASLFIDVNEKNSIKISGYLSNDKFRFGSDTTYSYSNRALVAKWNHIFNNKFYGVVSSTYSGYEYSVISTKNPVNAYQLNYSLDQIGLKADLHYNLGSKHLFDFGVASTYYYVNSGNKLREGPASLIEEVRLQPDKGLESAIYIADKFDISPRFSIYAGLRYSIYNYLGSKTLNKYAENLPINVNNQIGFEQFGTNEVIKTYHGPEVRISGKFSITESSSLKLSYNRTRQYISMLSNTTAIAPTDVWKLSDPYLKPQIGDQFSIGLYKNLRKNTIELSAEAYYKEIKDAINYKDGANLIVNKNIEADLVNSKGYAYGVEFMLKKNSGKLNGWVSYTYSRSFIQINDPFNNTVVNKGVYFPSNFDKPHSVNFIGNYKLNHRISISLNIVYSTGRPITFPDTKYQIDGVDRFYFSDRNQYRIPDYFRTDLSVNIEGNHKIKKLAHSSWSIGIYNLTGRKNVYSIYFKSEDGILKGYELSIFGSPIPTVTYNFKF